MLSGCNVILETNIICMHVLSFKNPNPMLFYIMICWYTGYPVSQTSWWWAPLWHTPCTTRVGSLQHQKIHWQSLGGHFKDVAVWIHWSMQVIRCSHHLYRKTVVVLFIATLCHFYLLASFMKCYPVDYWVGEGVCLGWSLQDLVYNKVEGGINVPASICRH